MCPVFFVRIFGMGVERGGLMRSADLGAVCGFVNGGRIWVRR